jgi:peptidyl-prolyl cis-trans isomerase C
MSLATHPLAATPRRVQVSVNRRPISYAAIAREVQNHPAESPAKAWQAAARALAIKELLIQEARRLGVVADPLTDEEGRRETPEEASMRALVEREARTPDCDEDACRRYFANNRRRFRTPVLQSASHILIAAAPGDAAARAVARDKASEIIASLLNSDARFENLARDYSACPSAARGGSLGQLSGGDTVPEFERALAAMQPGEFSRDPLETRFGFHVIRLDHRVESRELPYEAVSQRIRDYLGEAVRRRALAQYIGVLASRADIRGVEFAPLEELIVQ